MTIQFLFRHLLLLFLSVTLVSCTGDDHGNDANQGDTTGPIIESWTIVDYRDVEVLTFNSDERAHQLNK